jgi:transcriptional regulator with XRE-family HTH domain
MEMLISRDWLRRKIEADPDVETEAGVPSALLENLGMFLPPELQDVAEEKVIRLKEAFGVLIRQLRRRDGLSVDQLARKARVDEHELRQIECDVHYRPRPRTVHQISAVFDLPERAMMMLSGATITHDRSFEEQALRFAAKSSDMSSLNRDELRVLREYVKFLAESQDT